MAVADPDTELAETVRWALSLTGSFVVLAAVFGLLFIVMSMPALQLVPIVSPASPVFLWLAVIGFILGIATSNLDGESADVLTSVVEEYEDKPRREQFIYLISFLMVGIGGFNFSVALVGIGATVLADSLGLGLLGVAVAVWYPAIDIWLGRVVGWNLSTVGGLLTVLLMAPLAILYQVPPDIPRAAAANFRRNLLTH